MDTATKTPPQGARATDRVLEALSTVAALLDRSIREVQALDSDFQNRIHQAIHDTESSLQNQTAQHLEQALSETRTQLEERFKHTLSEMSAGWEGERSRLNGELNRLTQASAQWEAERARLNGELERLARVQAATQAEAEKAFVAAKAAVSSRPAPSANSNNIKNEMDRAQGLIKHITGLMEDSSTDLSTVIRKNVEKAELESYLRGIRFALNGGNSK
jgi:ABC-type transporter Mla subunit MlaD